MARTTTTASDSLTRGRNAFDRRAWGDAYRGLAAAERDNPLEPVDLERLATAAYLVGKYDEGADLHTRAQQEFLRRGDAEAAARCAFWLAFQFTIGGDVARSGGWLARAHRLIEDNGLDCALSGYVLIPAGIRRSIEGDAAGALGLFTEAVTIGTRFGDAQLVTMARNGQGIALVSLGRIAEGVSLLDEVMVAVTAGEMPPVTVGPLYCSLLGSCHETLEWRRATEWTEELSRWYASQPDLVPFRGQCLVLRAELMQVSGAWPTAIEEAGQACALLGKPPAHPTAGSAFYRRAELQRLRGDFEAAAESYRLASQYGRQPHPGLALLRLAQGQVDVAAAAIRHFMEQLQDRPSRAQLLAACAEIMLAANDISAARAAANRLAALLEQHETPFLRALCNATLGAVHLAEGDPSGALAALRLARADWTEVEAPYEVARVRALAGLAHRALGDEEMARLELGAAGDAFERLGARPDAARVAALAEHRTSRGAEGLTSRETEVLALLATGKTNRAIAQTLQISEKTVARHVANIFGKLSLSSRAAATAYAYQHRLV